VCERGSAASQADCRGDLVLIATRIVHPRHVPGLLRVSPTRTPRPISQTSLAHFPAWPGPRTARWSSAVLLIQSLLISAQAQDARILQPAPGSLESVLARPSARGGEAGGEPCTRVIPR